MIEKVNPKHPDKVADRIAGAIVDLGYKLQENPKIAVEVLIGHGVCHVICETSEDIKFEEVDKIIGPEIPKCVNNASPKSSYTFFVPSNTVMAQFFKERPAISLKSSLVFIATSAGCVSVTASPSSTAHLCPSPVEPVLG